MKRTFATTVIAGFAASVFGLATTSQSKPRVAVPNQVHEAGCSVETIRGSYGFYRSGTNPNGPIAGLGITTFDGRGGSSTIQTIRSNGVTTGDLFTDGTFEASYSVDSNCAGQFINSDGSAFGHAIVVGGGQEIFIMSLSGQNTITGVMKRISPALLR